MGADEGAGASLGVIRADNEASPDGGRDERLPGPGGGLEVRGEKSVNRLLGPPHGDSRAVRHLGASAGAIGAPSRCLAMPVRAYEGSHRKTKKKDTPRVVEVRC